MYSLKHKVTYSEISADKHISIAQAVRYFQDTSTFQSEAVGDTIEELEKKQCAWLLSAWQLEVNRYPVFGEELTISTWPYDSKGILAYRNFEMKDADGNSIIRANSIWFYFDSQTGMPRKILPEYVESYGDGEKLPMNYKGRKVILPKNVEGKKMDHFPVKKSDLDTNGHVNNSKYIEMASEYVEKTSAIKGMRVDYRKSATINDTIVPVIYEEANYIYVELSNGEIPFAVIEFEMDGEDK